MDGVSTPDIASKMDVAKKTVYQVLKAYRKRVGMDPPDSVSQETDENSPERRNLELTPKQLGGLAVLG